MREVVDRTLSKGRDRNCVDELHSHDDPKRVLRIASLKQLVSSAVDRLLSSELLVSLHH
jgi:hypothetical protein